MELADIFEKIANNARLTPHEMDFLKSSMRQTQLNNSFVAGMQNGSSIVNTNMINSKKFISGNHSMSGALLRVSGDVSLPTSDSEIITNWSVLLGDSLNGFSINSGYIHVPEPGLYEVIAHSSFTDNATGTFRRVTLDFDGYSTTKIVSPDNGNETYIDLYAWNFIGTFTDNTRGINVWGYHDATSTLSLITYLYIRRIGEWLNIPT